MTDWHLITGSRKGWERFCHIVGMKVIVHATQRVREQGESVAEATIWAIDHVAAGIEQDGAPAGMADGFRAQYRANLTTQMEMVAESVKSWVRLESNGAYSRNRRSKSKTRLPKRKRAGEAKAPS